MTRCRALTSLLLAGWIGTSAERAQANPLKNTSPPKNGEVVLIHGQVTDNQGAPFPRVLVELYASRVDMNFGKMRKEQRDEVHIGSYSDGQGEYVLRWEWHKFYNRFYVRASVSVPKGSGELVRHQLAEIDITDRIKKEASVPLPIQITDDNFLTNYRAFEASIDSDDKRQIYEWGGMPEKLEAERPKRALEEAWWYFTKGKVFRFEDGRLVETNTFEPVAAPES